MVQKKMTIPKALSEIINKSTELGITLIWREASFFESEFVTLEHIDLAEILLHRRAIPRMATF